MSDFFTLSGTKLSNKPKLLTHSYVCLHLCINYRGGRDYLQRTVYPLYFSPSSEVHHVENLSPVPEGHMTQGYDTDRRTHLWQGHEFLDRRTSPLRPLVCTSVRWTLSTTLLGPFRRSVVPRTSRGRPGSELNRYSVSTQTL